MSDVLFVVVEWLALLVSFRRAWQRRRLNDSDSLLIWSVFLFAGGAFIFRTPLIEQAINRASDGLPLAYWWKALCVLLAVGQYHRVLQRLYPLPPLLSRGLLGLLGIAWVGNSFIFWAGTQGWLTPLQTYYSMMTLADGVVLWHMVGVFIPANWRMYRQEQLEPMRLKHIATLTFCIFYAVSAALTQVLGPYTVLTGDATRLHQAVPVGIVVFFCFVIQVLPHRMIHHLLIGERLWLWWRLRRLERQVLTLAELDRPRGWHGLQAATYTACLHILDYSPLAAQKSAAGARLYEQIRRAAPPDTPYERLLIALARIA